MITWLAANRALLRLAAHFGSPSPCHATLGINASTSPVDNDSTLQPKAVLTVVVAAGSQGTVVAKAGVEILSLDQAQGKFPAQLNLKTPTDRQGESVRGVIAAAKAR